MPDHGDSCDGIIGAVIRKALDGNEALLGLVEAAMKEGVTRDEDRRLFPEFFGADEQLKGPMVQAQDDSAVDGE